MKISKVIPMFKSGRKTDVTKFRPISLLPQFSKILEKLFLTRINSFLIANNILSSSQYGFRTTLSTSLAMMELIEEITNATYKKNMQLVYDLFSFILFILVATTSGLTTNCRNLSPLIN